MSQQPLDEAGAASAPAPHQTVRVRHDTRRRLLTVASVTELSPAMRRIELTSPELGDFVSLSHDDHVKLFFPVAGAGTPAMRDFTPRRYDNVKRTLTIDFALHDAGPATQWAAAAKPGDALEIGGPRGSSVVPDDFDWYLMIGDETALPAIGRRLEELRPGVAVTTVVVTQAGGAQRIDTRANWTPHWVERPSAAADEAGLLLSALAGFQLPPGEGFVWIAAEASVARALRGEIVGRRGHPRPWTKSAGYWQRGEAGAHQTIDD